MILNPDDIEIGDWVAIYRTKSKKVPCPILMGVPLEVKAICLPYVGAVLGNQKVALDVRYFDLMKLHSEYVKVMSR